MSPIDATEYLKSSKANHEILCKSIKNMESGNYKETTLKDLKNKYLTIRGKKCH